MKKTISVFGRVVTGIVALSLTVPTGALHAATIDKNNTGANLNTGGVWVGGVVPTSGDVAQFGSGITSITSANIGANTNWLGISVTSIGPASFTIAASAGATLTLGSSGIDMTAATKPFTINCPLVLSAANVWDVAASRTLTIGSTVNNGGNLLTIQGAGATS